jgi:hypothetical protein
MPAGNSPDDVSKTQQACICGVPEATEMKYSAPGKFSTTLAVIDLNLFNMAP